MKKDTSKYEVDRPLLINKKKATGLMKDESGGRIIKEALY